MAKKAASTVSTTASPMAKKAASTASPMAKKAASTASPMASVAATLAATATTGLAGITDQQVDKFVSLGRTTAHADILRQDCVAILKPWSGLVNATAVANWNRAASAFCQGWSVGRDVSNASAQKAFQRMVDDAGLKKPQSPRAVAAQQKREAEKPAAAPAPAAPAAPAAPVAPMPQELAEKLSAVDAAIKTAKPGDLAKLQAKRQEIIAAAQAAPAPAAPTPTTAPAAPVDTRASALAGKAARVRAISDLMTKMSESQLIKLQAAALELLEQAESDAAIM